MKTSIWKRGGTGVAAAFALLLFLIAKPALFAQQQEDTGIRMGSYWKADFCDRAFVVPHSAITSLSLSRYIVDGAMVVTEVSVGTMGSVQGRFYYAEATGVQTPYGAGQSLIETAKTRVQEVGDRFGAGQVQTEVIKSYPLSTHAHTAEFRLASQDEVKKLYESLETSYLRRRTAVFKP